MVTDKFMTSKNLVSIGSPVSHSSFGRGKVEFSKGETTLIRFSHGIEECLTSELTILESVATAYLEGKPASNAQVVLKLLAETIRSIQDVWGVFSPSRIDLYPHQLWVCRKVTERWPVRWVVADDVGLGKTIEAGLILWRLFHLGLIQRFLILCPASLVPQWQERLFDMFDIRTVKYDPEQDSNRIDFWKLHPQVVASFHTLRQDRDNRHERMLQTDPWDLIIVDEAHHLNFDEVSGMTLAHRLIRSLQEKDQLKSLLLFTGTPHRGKHFGFLALMSLVRPDLFDPRKDVDTQLAHLPEALVRNNKYHVTNLRGERLFQKPEVTIIPYRYSPNEAAFYAMLTDFIASGRTYAVGLDRGKSRAVMLVLVALQKLASSSLAAVRSALQKRLIKLRELNSSIQEKYPTALNANAKMEEFDDDLDSLNPIIENDIVTRFLELMEDECDRLEELIEAANLVTNETKIEAILTSIKGLPENESVLFFTEYKATQALLISSLWREFGEGVVTFINGDEALPNVTKPSGAICTLRETRKVAAEHFNSGLVRFLVSTEAAGEGIDLQNRCSRLIHVDLPWNPMRLHQRVGRLNRIGQTEKVKVMMFQNPDTVESRIWLLLNEKLERIRCSLNAVTEDPEDLHQLILGVTQPGMLDQIFSEAESIPKKRLVEWFNQQTGQLGGEDAVLVVKNLLGRAQHFDFDQVSKTVPTLDLPNLLPFFRLILRLNRRQIIETDGVLAFKTPESWLKKTGIKARYEDVHFDRKVKTGKKGTPIGVGTRLLEVALEQACSMQDSFTMIDHGQESRLLLIFRCFDRITGNATQPKSIICGLLFEQNQVQVLKDWEVLRLLNELAALSKIPAETEPMDPVPPGDQSILSEAEKKIREAFPSFALPFRQPDIELLGIISGVTSR